MDRAYERPTVTSVVWQDAAQIHELQGEAIEGLRYLHRLPVDPVLIILAGYGLVEIARRAGVGQSAAARPA